MGATAPGIDVKAVWRKSAHETDIRRFVFGDEGILTFDALISKVKGAFSTRLPTPVTTTTTTTIELKYMDEEGDLISVDSDAEVAYLYSRHEKIGAPLLRLFVFTDGDGNNSTFKEVVHSTDQPSKEEEIKESTTPHLHATKKGHKKLLVQVVKKKCGKGLKKASENNKLVARFVKHVTFAEENTEMPPNTPFLKTWRFRNEGTATWPEGTQLIFVSKKNGDLLGAAEPFVIVPCVEPGAEVDVTVKFVSPAQAGRYVGFWRLCSPTGKKFGQRVWVQIQVVCPSPSTSAAEENSSSSSSEAHSPVSSDSSDAENHHQGHRHRRHHRHGSKAETQEDKKVTKLQAKLAKLQAKLDKHTTKKA